MSHFSVLVIGEDVDAQMAPFHEYECTGDDNPYIVEVDKTEEARADYDGHTAKMLKDSKGKLHNFYAVKREEQPLMESAPAKKVSNEMAVYSDQLNRMLKND